MLDKEMTYREGQLIPRKGITPDWLTPSKEMGSESDYLRIIDRYKMDQEHSLEAPYLRLISNEFIEKTDLLKKLYIVDEETFSNLKDKNDILTEEILKLRNELEKQDPAKRVIRYSSFGVFVFSYILILNIFLNFKMIDVFITEVCLTVSYGFLLIGFLLKKFGTKNWM